MPTVALRLSFGSIPIYYHLVPPHRNHRTVFEIHSVKLTGCDQIIFSRYTTKRLKYSQVSGINFVPNCCIEASLYSYITAKEIGMPGR